MTQPMTRRTFLNRAGCLGAAAAMAGPLGQSILAAEKASRPAWPVTCRDAMLRQTGAKDCWSALLAIGAEGVEAVVNEELALPGLFHPDVKYTAATPAGLERLTADAKTAGQRITALCMNNRFEQRPDEEIVWCRKVAAAAKTLGVPAIRVDVVPQKLARDEFLKSAIETLRKVMAETEPTGVRFAIENHGNTTNDPDFLTALFDGVGSQRLGLTLDTGNFYWFGHPLSKLYGLYEKFAPRAFHTHCKSIRYPEADRERQRPMGYKYGEYHGPIYDGDVDFRRVIGILQKAGYDNDLCIENESLGKKPPEEAVKILAKEIEMLKKLRPAAA
jgi:sugar phosphate isomerase/epimerase